MAELRTDWDREEFFIVEQSTGEACVWPQCDSDASGVNYSYIPKTFNSFEVAVEWCSGRTLKAERKGDWR